MKNLKELTERKATLLERMEGLVDKAKTEKRNFTGVENAEIETIKADIKGIEEELRAIKDNRADFNKSNTEFRSLKDAVQPGEPLEKRGYSKYDLGKLVKGICGFGWEGAENEFRYAQDMNTSNNTTIIPVELSNMIYDYARNSSAIMGQIPVITMPHGNMTIATQTKDIAAGFVEEGGEIPLTDVAFAPVELKGKCLAGIIPITEQLLQTSNISNILMGSIAKAITSQLDKALLYGTGSENQIKGISQYAGINKLPADAMDYDALIRGAQLSKKENVTPTHIAYSTQTGTELSLLKNTNGDYLNKPAALNDYTVAESNNVNDNEAYIFDAKALILGLQKNITIEVGTNSDDFRRLKKSIRIYVNADLGVLNQKAVTQVTVS